MWTSYIGLGSNLYVPQLQIKRALEAVARLPGSQLVRSSRMYRSAPWGEISQPDFVNAVAELQTDLSPRALLDALLAIEAAFGRVRNQRWGPRIIDLDLLTYGDSIIVESNLRLPHPRLHERAFVLLPLRELAPAMQIPGQGRVDDLCMRLDGLGCYAFDEMPVVGD